MQGSKIKIGVVAPGNRIEPAIAEKVSRIAMERHGDRLSDILFHPQCFLSSGHFAGDDGVRRAAFLEFANDPAIDVIWFARGGYGACRLTDGLFAELTDAANAKTYLGYSDAGCLLAGLYKAGIGKPAHGPMPSDMARKGGAEAIERALAFLIDGATDSLEPNVAPGTKTVAFNLTILSQLLGTPIEPDLADHVLMLEEIDEHMYRIDRYLFHITSNPAIRRVTGIRLGRCAAIPPNDPDFVRTEEEVIAYWCEKSGIPYLGRADIGHDVDNKIVPFG